MTGMPMPESYLLGHSTSEVERLSKWAEVWEPAARAMLERIPVQEGWRCLDLGCGPRGILGPLSQKVGPAGRVVGADLNQNLLAAADQYVKENNLNNVELARCDAFQTDLLRSSFDLVHCRFLFAPLGREDALLGEMLALARPGGVVAIQEPDVSSYQCEPPRPAWEKLKELTVAAFARGGGDYNAGRRSYNLLRRAGLQDIDARAAVLVLPAGHPYRLWPVESARATQGRLLEWRLVTEVELDALLKECEQIAADPDIFITTFMVVQVWGRKPGGQE